MIADFLPSPARVVLDGTEYELSPLTLSDYAACAQELRSQSIQATINACVGTPMPAAIISGAIAQAATARILLEDILADPVGRKALIFQSLKRTNKAITRKMVDELAPRTHRMLIDICEAISGLMESEDEAPDPTIFAVPNSTVDVPSKAGETA